ncbi:hypothetical protein DFH11DRAFT_470252 [Phellopilus nigrolimitatus]|nr:hypothetical protein DFH11DRAFT_470252 [Phellopilus nigrolimitatus]
MRMILVKRTTAMTATMRTKTRMKTQRPLRAVSATSYGRTSSVLMRALLPLRLSAAPTIRRKTRKEEAAFATMKTVLAYAASDPLVHSTLSGTAAPGFVDSNMLDVLSKIMTEGRITKQAAGPLSQVLVKLAQSELLFSPLPTLPMSLHKRKRDEGENSTPPPAKRTAAPEKTLEDATPAEPPQAEAEARLDETREELEEKRMATGLARKAVT